MYYKEKRIPDGEVANCFASFFEEKVEKIVKSAIINPDVYNGTRKLVADKAKCHLEYVQIKV